ncbi:DUF6705 family protein [uncultured Chryseobacterium sp.]|jgi:hypothetical protein|uniref:DUF6705 family protein n=1 Tax=uncultured Chryseobacterium sp. TaxID=259322 RepID=UPI002612A5CB|nr:DUF6705 family protein [uncultured Chryseobacterium sp.]
MKNIIFKISFIIGLTSIMLAKSQTIIIWGQKNSNLPKNFLSTGQYYYKDVYNYLDNFTGTWEYVNGNEKFQIILTKFVKYHNIDPAININVYEDAIGIQYKKFENGNLVFESPLPNKPGFTTRDGIILEGYMNDYGRTTVEVKSPSFGFLEQWIIHKGSEYFHPSCNIELLPLSLTHPPRIKFNLYLRETGGFGSPYDNPAYQGQPLFSIPNDIIMAKVP